MFKGQGRVLCGDASSIATSVVLELGLLCGSEIEDAAEERRLWPY